MSIINGTAGNDNLNGTSNNDQISGLAGNDVLNGLAGNDQLFGNAGNDTLNGGTGNDTLDGGLGNDNLSGGTGNDNYLVDSSADVVTETSTVTSEIDQVVSSVNYTLGANVENLGLYSTAIEAVGNSLNNFLSGNSNNNILIGNEGNDFLNGQVGRDTMTGGTGNDTYFIDAANDVVNETVTTVTEIDTVQSSVTYSLGVNIENLTLTGTSAINGTGNQLNNLIVGNSANNTLNGGAGNDNLIGGLGNDTLIGGTGNDIYVVDSSADVITESNLATDIERVQASSSYSLSANVENLVLTGSAAINGTGNTQNNALTGNTAANSLDGGAGNDFMDGGAGNDTLIGGAGTDIIVGGAGGDRFTFSSGQPFATASFGVDFISDFAVNTDKIVLSKTTFSNITSNVGDGFSVSGEFAIVTNDSLAETSSAAIVYNATNGRLFYNENGAAAGFGNGDQFAKLQTVPIIRASDFVIIA